MKSEIYLQIASIIEDEQKRVQKFDTPLEQVLENIAERLTYEASIIKQNQGNCE